MGLILGSNKTGRDTSTHPMAHREKSGTKYTYCGISTIGGVPSGSPPPGTPRCKICW